MMELTYEKCGDYLIPNLIPNVEPEEPLTKYGLMRKRYLQEYHRGIYSGMLLSGKLKGHLLTIQTQADERFDNLVIRMARKEGVTGQLKAQDQIQWIRKMNNIRARTDEIVIDEIVCCL